MTIADPNRLLITFFNPKLRRQLLYSAPSCGGPSTPLTHIPTAQGFRVSYSAQGLVCFYDDEDALICNPSHRQILTLPPTALPFDLTAHLNYNASCAIAYDASVGVHKVLRACTFTARVPQQNSFDDGHLLEVLTLGGDHWRTLHLPEGVKLIEDQQGGLLGCVLNGAVHYKGLRRIGDNIEEHVIVALGLEDERFRVHRAPNSISIGSSLVEMDGKLGLRGEYDERGLALIMIYEGEGEMMRIQETTVTKKAAWFSGSRSCREKTWGGMEKDGTCAATVSLADGREVVLMGRLDGLNESSTFVDYEYMIMSF